MAYNEAFWVVAGTAAPVIALATVVTIGDGAASARFFTRLAASSTGSSRSDALASQGDAVLNLGLSFATLIAQATILILALVKIYYRSGPDLVQLWTAVSLEGYSVVVLVLVTLLTARTRESRSDLERRTQARTSAPGRRPRPRPSAQHSRPAWQRHRRPKPSGSSSASGK